MKLWVLNLAFSVTTGLSAYIAMDLGFALPGQLFAASAANLVLLVVALYNIGLQRLLGADPGDPADTFLILMLGVTFFAGALCAAIAASVLDGWNWWLMMALTGIITAVALYNTTSELMREYGISRPRAIIAALPFVGVLDGLSARRALA